MKLIIAVLLIAFLLYKFFTKAEKDKPCEFLLILALYLTGVLSGYLIGK